MGSVKCIDDSFYGSSNYNNSNTSNSWGGGGGKPVVFPGLRSFKIEGMEKLETWMDASATTGTTSCLVVFPCLEELYIDNCGINLLPHEAFRGARTSLKRLKIDGCSNLETIPTLQGFTSLEELRIWNCLPEGLSCLARLKELSLGRFSEDLQSFKLILQGVFHHSKLSLRSLELVGQSEWESIPEELQHLTALTDISLHEFGMEALPDWFGNLSSLEELGLYYCEKLKSLPSMEAMGRLTKLKRKEIHNCPLLKERVAEWSKIAHIPDRDIYFD